MEIYSKEQLNFPNSINKSSVHGNLFDKCISQLVSSGHAVRTALRSVRMICFKLGV